MKRTASFLLVGFLLLAGAGCQTKREDTWTLIGVRTWPVGEARVCTLDGQSHQGHCFPPEEITDMIITRWPTFMVKVDFNKPPSYDKDGWAYSVTCRLDSTTQATCN